MERTQVAVVGSGFAGALLARLLARQGLAVTLIERGQHPRFAIGESTTPLANLCLGRLRGQYGLPDLHHLAAHGRWLAHLPGLRRGLKRGFTFYRHEAQRPYANDAANRAAESSRRGTVTVVPITSNTTCTFPFQVPLSA